MDTIDLRKPGITFTGQRAVMAATMLFVSALLVVAASFPPALFVLLAVSLATAGFSVWAALKPSNCDTALRMGQRGLVLLFVLTLAAFISSAGDWTHTLWNVQFPIAGLFLGSGVLLVRVWAADREQHALLRSGWNGAVVAFGALVLLGSMPVLLALTAIEFFPVGRATGSPVHALLEVARYGFDGTVPALMEPESAQQMARGLGSPPRFVTVTMGATHLAAASWILFVALALIGRAIPAGRMRWTFLLISPAVVAGSGYDFLASTWSEGVWRNEPWLVATYGPVMATAALAALVLFGVVRWDRRLLR